MRLAQGHASACPGRSSRRALTELLADPDPEQVDSASMEAMLQMRKIDIAELERAAAAEGARA